MHKQTHLFGKIPQPTSVWTENHAVLDPSFVAFERYDIITLSMNQINKHVAQPVTKSLDQPVKAATLNPSQMPPVD